MRLNSASIYQVTRLSGLGLSFGALGAAILDYPTVAICSLSLGIALFITGTVGAWWNSE